MATKTLPKTPFQLQGGCFCAAIRYKISVPELSERKELPRAGMPADRLLMPLNEVNERMPIITLDHCNSCRRAPGSIVHSWFISPPEWVEFTLERRKSGDEEQKIDATCMAYLQEDKTLAERTWVTHFKKSENSNRTFCGRCGTQMTFFRTGAITPLRQVLGPFLDISLGTFDQEYLEMEGFRPVAQFWHDHGIPWVVKLVSEGKKGLLDDVVDDLAALKVEDAKEK